MELSVLVADPVSEAGLQLLEEAGVRVKVATGLDEEALREELAHHDGLIVRSGTRVTATVLEGARRLKVIGRAGVGVDNIDVEAATRRGIVVINAPGGNTVATAEHTIAMMMALARHIPQAHISLTREKRWERQRFMGVQLSEKTLGIIGLGRVGAEVARRANALGMKVLAYDPYVSEERARTLKVTMTDVETICREADFITVHTPLTKATRGLLGAREMALMKPGVRLINCARGGIIDEAALLQALQEGRVAGAALDVFEEEPPPDDHPLLGRDDVVVTPHLGASTREAQVNVAVEVARDMLNVLRGEPVASAVNIPTLPREQFAALRPYLDLAERLGRLYTEIIADVRGRIEIVYSGEVTDYDVTPITHAVLKGLLEPVLQEQVNYVNAPLLAREREVQVAEVKEALGPSSFRSLIALRHRDPQGVQRQVAGTLTGDGVPTLVLIDDYRVNVDTPGYLLIAHNIDRPGVIGRVGTLLGERGINIAYMQVGRRAVGSHAVMVLGLDNPVTDDVLQKLNEFDDLWDIHHARW